MRIVNGDGTDHSAFVYNESDGLQWIALASKPMDAGDTWDWDPPKNDNGKYSVLFHRWPGGGAGIIGSGTGGADATFTYANGTVTVS